jgi:hypothetical protein
LKDGLDEGSKILLNKGKSRTITKFAKLLNYPRASNTEFKRILRFLEINEFVVVQQGGFLGDNMHHDVIVTTRKPLELDRFRRVILTRVNYSIGEYVVHRSESKRKCDKCKHVISIGERYGTKPEISEKNRSGKHHVFAVHVLCLLCLLEKHSIDDLMEL